jgi:hypothetical protein
MANKVPTPHNSKKAGKSLMEKRQAKKAKKAEKSKRASAT